MGLCLCICLQGLAAYRYQTIADSLNREETGPAQFDARLAGLNTLLGDLLREIGDSNAEARDYLLRIQKIFFSGRLHAGRVQLVKNGEFYRYFDLCLFNAIYFRHRLDEGLPARHLKPVLQARLTEFYLAQASEPTRLSDYLLRRSFLMDFELSPHQAALNATEKVRLKAFINTPYRDDLRRGIQDTDRMLNLVRPYLKFQDAALVKDLFEFNMGEAISRDKTTVGPAPVGPESPVSRPGPLREGDPGRESFRDQLPMILVITLVGGFGLALLYGLARSHLGKGGFGTTRPSLLKTPFDSQRRKPRPQVAVTRVDPVSQMMLAHLPDRYQGFWKIGRGGMGVVFGALDIYLQRKVAIKMISPGLCDDAEIVKRFVNEARSVAALDHPHILKIYDVGGGDYPYFVMEFLNGRSMEESLVEARRIPPGQIQFYSLQVADALSYCHRQGIIHRDIKPGNILLVNQDRYVKLVDFGIAKSTRRSDMTRTNGTIGSPIYMAPEQMQQGASGVSTDIYAFGVTLYQMATGVFPFDEHDMVRKLTEEPLSLHAHMPDFPKLMGAMIMKCIRKDPAMRFESFEQIGAVLARMPAEDSK